ncbi:thyroid transcription factor 1-associated protein 26 [Tachyglossus aculeatus]|uniref:thyroid transcription factor 1-associated protein 26 n=1 Tax=Tachyglossus aculeatus TaxID=9261 RepID=UPI0018F3B859|nr:thyroid transcription factor 1-associated protein 26 [Tachyglossus aculeatus]
MREGKAMREAKTRRPWRPDPRKPFVGSVREGQGFAFRRKQKIQQKYTKFLRKKRGSQLPSNDQFTETYPEHLKHLYVAEEALLSVQRRKDHQLSSVQSSPTVSSVAPPKKNKKKTSNQKAKEEYDMIVAKRAAKKQEAEKRKQEREEAQKQYKKKKMEAFKILSQRTRKGQPKLNVQMEYLLQKIQEKQ